MDDVCVSVVIPYGPEFTPRDMLEAAEESARSQDVPVELVVVEDADSRGPSWARNRGIERVSNRYVAFLDADDRWLEGKLSRQLDEMAATGRGLCVEAPDIDTATFVRELYLGNLQSMTSSIVVDTERVAATFHEGLTHREDHLYMLEAAAEAGVCTCEDLFVVGRHSGSYASTLTTVRRFRKDREFAAAVRERVPEVRDFLEAHYDEIHCGVEPTANTPGDLGRLYFIGAAPHTYIYLALSYLCQRL